MHDILVSFPESTHIHLYMLYYVATYVSCILQYEMTPLHYGADSEDSAVVEALIRAKANVNAVDKVS